MMKALCLAIALSASAAAAANPWFGTWKLRPNAAGETPETLVYSDAGGGAMRMVSVEQGSVIVTRFDGRPSPNAAAGKSREPVLAVRAMSPTRYAWTFFRSGKPYVRGVNTLAANRKSFTERSWLVTKPDTIVTLIYDRQ